MSHAAASASTGLPDGHNGRKLHVCALVLMMAGLAGCQTISREGSTANDDRLSSFVPTVSADRADSPDEILDQARELQRTGHSDKALPLLADLIHQAPAPAHQNDQLSDSQTALSTQTQTVALELLVAVTLDLQDWRLHRAALKQLAARHPSSASVQNRAGKALLQSLRIEAANRALADSKSASATDSKSIDPPVSLISDEIIRQAGTAALHRATELEPRNAVFTQDLVSALLDQDRHAEAERVLIAALRENPTSGELPMVAARFFESRENWMAAIRCYDLALRNSPENRIWQRQRAMCHYRLKQFDEAAYDFRQALHGTPVRRQLTEFIAWGDAAMKAENYSEAQRILDRLVEEGNARTADLEVLRTVCRVRLGDLQGASAVLARARRDWPQHEGLRHLQLTSTEPIGIPVALQSGT